MKNKKTYIIFSTLIIIFSVCIVDIVLQNDSFSAIKIGDYILHNGIDFVEHFNYDNTLVWHNSRWLFNIIISLFHSSFGLYGVYYFTMIMNAIIGLTIFNCLLKRKNNIILSFFISIFTLYLTAPYVTGRAQIVSFLLFFLEIYSIEQLIDTNKKRYIVYIVLSSILIANIHTTVWPMTMVLFIPYFLEYFLSKTKLMKKTKSFYLNISNIKFLLITFILVCFSGLLTPLGSTPYTYMFKTMSGISTKFISELQMPNIFTNHRFLIITIILILLFVKNKNKIKISDLFMIIGLFIMSIMAGRNIGFLYYIGAFIIVRLITQTLSKHRDSIEKITDRLNKVNYPFIFISIVIISASLYNFSLNYNKNLVDEKEYPVGASNYILDNLDLNNIRIYNGFHAGSYLEYRGIKVFLDSRSEVYTKEFNNTTILDDFYDINYGKKSYYEVFKKYNFTHILVYKTEIINQYIQYDSNYKKIYEDDNFILYEKI
ncbi:MAG: hypothetical protein IJH20_06885 [Bacilli bacterium]|nr:hypothetical protein [Bacilli bacterium]